MISYEWITINEFVYDKSLLMTYKTGTKIQGEEMIWF